MRQEGLFNSLLEPGGNPPDPPLQAWLADGGYTLGPVIQKAWVRKKAALLRAVLQAWLAGEEALGPMLRLQFFL